MDRPVVARWLGELSGAVERVDDPDAVGLQPRKVVRTLLGQDGVLGPVGLQRRRDQGVPKPVAGILQGFRVTAVEPLTELQQRSPRGCGDGGSESAVVAEGLLTERVLVDPPGVKVER